MSRTLAILIVLSLVLSACMSSSPSLWGVPQTPTPNTVDLASAPIDPFAIQDHPIDFPTSTVPPEIATENAYTPTPTITPNSSTPVIEPTYTLAYDAAPFLYYAQSGDMLSAVANRFGVDESEITSDADLTKTTLIDPGTLLVIPNRITEPMTPYVQIMPDAELIFSYTAVDFDVKEYVQQSGGYLSKFKDYLGSTGWIDGDAAIERLATENSINPRLILAMLEFESRWVRGQPVDELHIDYPMGFNDYHYKGMSVQLTWAINNLAIGYYSWRAGTLTHLEFPDGTTMRIDPRLNAGTVAIQYLFSRSHSPSQWEQIINPSSGFPAMFNEMFGDPWARADAVNPIFPSALNQPPLVLPFEPDVEWSMTGGPHNAWGQINPKIYGPKNSVFAAIDFAPATDHGGCDPTPTWVTAAAPGLVVRSSNGAVMVDLDGDGYEQTGWNLLYMHVGAKDRVAVGTWLEVNDRIGHASCEGGVSTGTHLHFARKYNGEWVTADGPIPFIMSGWRVVAGEKAYEGKLVRGEEVVIADPVGQKWSNIFRKENE
ncbi:MAG TPA: LysM peptidoglycan-binding domain-containing protein [Anaerolineales bacterium]|nr:LysM peptidoglycan-binding domain-containing protein [Anaerolineales bacterium]HMV96077.1 LysM peptidoglycan-binding domain-containing protein [Anaerolineales bacterium]HMX75422.1 LysM peptidoglycan-binding domain-containing protein [Anaerolineales bacterium]HNB85100.1 LysM peptidoglycan-binding domain-containing protein [Anaerolineales bacterium]HNC87511.1 LysM peptidoglycan-binding domain-containing protein [Anaerolineales bacterium]